MNQREYNSGYQAAIDAIREQVQKQRKAGGDQQNPSGNQEPAQSGGGSGGQSPSQGPDGRMMPPGMNQPQQEPNNGQSGQSQGSSRGSGNQGVVRPEDCIGPSALMEIPGTDGGFIDSKTGDSIVEVEGYSKEGGNDDQRGREWKDNALKAARQLKQQTTKRTTKSQGGGPAAFAARLESIYKPTKDWKKELKKIVGMAITPDDPRKAYANKNALVSQDRIARTDKDRYESMDYMVAMVDTSGSMSEKDIKACLGELYAVALAKKPLKLVLMYFGSGVSKIDVFDNLNQFKKEMRSPKIAAGGGTEVEPCFRMLENDPRFKRKAADLVMIFTDGWIDQVKRNPKTTKFLCWVIVDNPGFDLQYKDIRTKCVHIKKEDMGR